MGTGGEQEIDLLFWQRYARTAQVLNVFIVAIDLAYVLATWNSGPHRTSLLVLNAVALVAIIAGVATNPELKIAMSPHRDLIFAAWGVSGTALIAVAIALDGGLASPLAWLFPLSVMYTATVHRPKLVVLSGAGALAAFLVLGINDDGPMSSAAHLAVRSSYLIALTYAAAITSKLRWNHYDAQLALRKTLSTLAQHDGLTGLLNHRSFHELLDDYIVDSRPMAVPVALLLIDLDHFKAINDTHGHLVGDEVLKNVARAIVASIRSGDAAARVGGEEFCILLPGAHADDARAVAERVRTSIESIAAPAAVTTSIGLSSGTTADITTRALLDRADGALYEAKRTGRNRVCWLKVVA
jgi:diguanylate cyclase (GGDEF)-like protein